MKFGVVMAMIAVASMSPASARPSKLKIVASVPVESRFRKPGEPRASTVRVDRPGTSRSLATKPKPARVKPRRRDDQSMNVIVQAHRETHDIDSRVSLRSESRPYVPRLTTNNLSIELAGRGGLYSLDYDRQLGRSVSMGVGFSYLSMRLNVDDYAAVNATLITVPFYGNFYFNSNPHHRIMGTGGVTIVSAKAEASAGVPLTPEAKEMVIEFVSDLDLSANASVVLPMPVAGGGYEYKSSGGLLVRAAFYALYVGEVRPWAGLAFGGHF